MRYRKSYRNQAPVLISIWLSSSLASHRTFTLHLPVINKSIWFFFGVPDLTVNSTRINIYYVTIANSILFCCFFFFYFLLLCVRYVVRYASHMWFISRFCRLVDIWACFYSYRFSTIICIFFMAFSIVNICNWGHLILYSFSAYVQKSAMKRQIRNIYAWVMKSSDDLSSRLVGVQKRELPYITMLLNLLLLDCLLALANVCKIMVIYILLKHYTLRYSCNINIDNIYICSTWIIYSQRK